MTLVHARALLSIEKTNLVLVVVLVLESKGLDYYQPGFYFAGVAGTSGSSHLLYESLNAL